MKRHSRGRCTKAGSNGETGIEREEGHRERNVWWTGGNRITKQDRMKMKESKNVLILQRIWANFQTE